MKNDGGGGEGGCFQRSTEIKAAFLHSHMKAEGPLASSGTNGSELTRHSKPLCSFRHIPVKSVL